MKTQRWVQDLAHVQLNQKNVKGWLNMTKEKSLYQEEKKTFPLNTWEQYLSLNILFENQMNPE